MDHASKEGHDEHNSSREFHGLRYQHQQGYRQGCADMLTCAVLSNALQSIPHATHTHNFQTNRVRSSMSARGSKTILSLFLNHTLLHSLVMEQTPRCFKAENGQVLLS
eukprot:2387799-Amphidinium_carterae.1